ncbi:MAG: DinB family protein [Anaerolineales bacterium]|nr:DinB family protein [Anaerolineales bacterium]
MIADQIRRLFTYNTWAWQHVFVGIEQLDTAAYHAERPIFHGSLHGLLVHALSAEHLWYERCRGNNPEQVFDPAAFADFSAVRARWGPVRHSWANYLQWLDDEACKQFVDYRTTDGAPYSMRLLDILQHVVNHATEHRSQMTLLLFQLGISTMPIDYARFRTRL